ncbi:unnamed protein product, partial [marine sediment metagenome]
MSRVSETTLDVQDAELCDEAKAALADYAGRLLHRQAMRGVAPPPGAPPLPYTPGEHRPDYDHAEVWFVTGWTIQEAPDGGISW